MAVTFARAVKKNTQKTSRTPCPYMGKIEVYIRVNYPDRKFDYRFKQKMAIELKSHPIEEVTSQLLEGYFRFKIAMPRTPYNNEVLEYVKSYHHKTKYTAESIYITAKQLCPTLADSTIYYWFNKLGSNFSTAYDSYEPYLAIMIWYLAEIKQRSLKAKITEFSA
jgi:hypothetical protein